MNVCTVNINMYTVHGQNWILFHIAMVNSLYMLLCIQTSKNTGHNITEMPGCPPNFQCCMYAMSFSYSLGSLRKCHSVMCTSCRQTLIDWKALWSVLKVNVDKYQKSICTQGLWSVSKPWWSRVANPLSHRSALIHAIISRSQVADVCCWWVCYLSKQLTELPPKPFLWSRVKW